MGKSGLSEERLKLIKDEILTEERKNLRTKEASGIEMSKKIGKIITDHSKQRM